MKNGSFRYNIPEGMVKQILKDRRGAEAKMNKEEYLRKYIDATYGILGTCTSVTTY